MITVDIQYAGTGFGFTLFFWGLEAEVKWRGQSKTLNLGTWKEKME